MSIRERLFVLVVITAVVAAWIDDGIPATALVVLALFVPWQLRRRRLQSEYRRPPNRR